MSHLHLPAEHSEADLVLAANLADFVGSEDLYVAWTHRDGAGAVPEVEAILRDERPSLLAELLGDLRAGLSALWYAFLHGPAPVAPAIAPAPSAPRQHSA
jgi:hypothetical protein